MASQIEQQDITCPKCDSEGVVLMKNDSIIFILTAAMNLPWR